MLDWLAEYGMFLAKALTFVVAGLLLVGGAVAIGSRRKHDREGRIELKCLSEDHQDLDDDLKSVLLSEDEFKKYEKSEKKRRKEEAKAESESKPRIFVLDFDGDVKASAVESLRREISAILVQADPERDEILLRLESGGGMVHAYGLAASQLQRIREQGIKLTIAVDKVAASGGYMMACVASHIIAAPFALLGSIGVVAQLPNFHRLLQKHDVDYEMFTAGKYKRTVTMLGENTDEGREKFREEIEITHELFKSFVAEQRPQLNLDELATGEVWFGSQAADNGLIDEVKTSDTWIFEKIRCCEVYAVEYVEKQAWQDKLATSFSGAVERAVVRLVGYDSGRKF